MRDSILALESVYKKIDQHNKKCADPQLHYYISLGLSPSSKGVMYVSYLERQFVRDPKMAGIERYVSSFVFHKILGATLETAVDNLTSSCRGVIELPDPDEFAKRRLGSGAFPFGKYKGKTAHEVAEIDLSYIDFICSRMNAEFNPLKIKSQPLKETLREYEKTAYMRVVEINREKSAGYAGEVGDKVEIAATVYKIKANNFGTPRLSLKTTDGKYLVWNTTKEIAEGDTVTGVFKIKRCYDFKGMEFTQIGGRVKVEILHNVT